MEKLTLALCDDENFVHDEVDKLLGEFFATDFILLHYYSATELLEARDMIDCLLLDIEMPKIDGIAAAEQLRHRHKEYPIIMLTSQVERFKEVFHIRAFRFVTKPISNRELSEALKSVLLSINSSKKVTVYQDRQPYEITSSDILYINSQTSHSVIYTRKNEYRSEYSLKKWKEVLDDTLFFQCHKSYIVNLNEVRSVEKSIAILSSGEKVPISRRERTAFTYAFMKYDTIL